MENLKTEANELTCFGGGLGISLKVVLPNKACGFCRWIFTGFDRPLPSSQELMLESREKLQAQNQLLRELDGHVDEFLLPFGF